MGELSRGPRHSAAATSSPGAAAESAGPAADISGVTAPTAKKAAATDSSEVLDDAELERVERADLLQSAGARGSELAAFPGNREEDVAMAAAAAYRRLLDVVLGAAAGAEEAQRGELDRTPLRAAKAFIEMTSGHAVRDPLSVIGKGIFELEGAQDLVVVRDMPFHSLCEHHLLPFSGVAHVAYIPNGRVLGLSKFARLLRVFARRLQLQERLTTQLAETLVRALSPQGVAVAVEARHACMCMRGVGSPAVTRTLALRGARCREPEIKQQLLSGVRGGGEAAGAANGLMSSL
eukprot:TRINITY_DN34650_c0_g1_i1.p1 TRINITY_DN34650_c0_g1~~TRINITY_DN34650_c0_g1_i1.p1  ORF type:complete len:292 (-),score=53.81 TRINITY_DN34650_c0_g1_i1:171-1046(-)